MSRENSSNRPPGLIRERVITAVGLGAFVTGLTMLGVNHHSREMVIHWPERHAYAASHNLSDGDYLNTGGGILLAGAGIITGLYKVGRRLDNMTGPYGRLESGQLRLPVTEVATAETQDQPDRLPTAAEHAARFDLSGSASGRLSPAPVLSARPEQQGLQLAPKADVWSPDSRYHQL